MTWAARTESESQKREEKGKKEEEGLHSPHTKAVSGVSSSKRLSVHIAHTARCIGSEKGRSKKKRGGGRRGEEKKKKEVAVGASSRGSISNQAPSAVP